MKILVSYLFPVTNKKNHCYVQQFCYLEKYVEENNVSEILFVSFNKTQSDLKRVLSLSKFKYPNIITHISLGNLFKNSYKEIGEELIKSLGEINQIKEIFLFGGIILNQRNINDLIEYYGDNLKSFTFLSFRLRLIKIFFFNYLINDLKINTSHIVFDPVELSFSNKPNYKKFHNYDDPHLSLNRLDSLQYQLLNKENRDIFNKDLDFVFGASVVHNIRKEIHPIMLDLLDLSSPTFLIYYQNKFIPKFNTFLPREKYLELIKRSKYTLVIKAYEKSTFSASRFIESIFFGNIPLLMVDSNYYHLKSLGFNIDWLERNLVVKSPNDILNKIKTLDYDSLIRELQIKLNFLNH